MWITFLTASRKTENEHGIHQNAIFFEEIYY